MARGGRAWRDALHGTGRGEARRPAKGFTGREIGHRPGDELLSGRGQASVTRLRNAPAAKLDEIDNYLRKFGGEQKCYVDTGPILERDHAAQAGIGWHGKSTMLINARLGTWFFLAEILTTLELPPDAPERDRCGTCERCITACPTGAITAAHRLDARRCISYLTIELKTSIPLELRPLVGDRIFGCDDCLDACPWNRFAQVSRESAFAAQKSTIGMALRDYLDLNDEQFRDMFRHSPIKRIKRSGFLRNVCIALGNVGDESDLPALERARTHMNAEPMSPSCNLLNPKRPPGASQP